MNDATIPQAVLFPDLADRPIVIAFDQPYARSDGGAILFKAADRRVGLIDALVAVWRDPREAAKVTELFRRTFWSFASEFSSFLRPRSAITE